MARTNPTPLPPAPPDRERPKRRHRHRHRPAARKPDALKTSLLWAGIALALGLLFVRFLLAAAGGGP